MKSIVQADCGGPNALVGLAQNYGSSNQRLAPTVRSGSSSLLPSSSIGEQFADDYLRQKASTTPAPSTFDMKTLAAQLPSVSTSSRSLANKWSSEYTAQCGNQLASLWSQQYAVTRPSYESAWASSLSTAPSYPAMLQSSSSVDSSMWSSEYLDNFDTSLQSTSLSSELADSWAQEFTAGRDIIWRSMEDEWEAIRKNVALAQGDEIINYNTDVYEHQVDNPFLSDADALTEGDRFMQSGDLGNAMLAYEAAVQKNPKDAEAWCRLGLSHAENENDSKAIQAFRECLKIQPNNEEALLALSVSLANELAENDALLYLEKWLVVHQGGDPMNVQKSPAEFTHFINHDTFKQVEERFLSVARQQSGTADADLQNALGVLYNLNKNYDRAVECIKLAIANRPDDARLWNRLGATLANGNRTPEAVAAYREALKLYPLYVRARYNLGISCLHLDSYKEAVEHFVSALELQKGGTESSSIWPTLRSATIRMQEASDELFSALEHRDLNAFKSAFTQTQSV